MAKKKDYIIEMEKVRAAQNVIENLYLGGDPEQEITQAQADEMKQTYWEVIGEPPPQGVMGEEVAESKMAPRTLNAWNC